MAHYLLTDSTIVSGRLVRQDTSVVVIRKRNGYLTYIQPYQIVRLVDSGHRSQASQTASELRSFALKDGAVVYGRIVKETPVAVVVMQPNGAQTYIDPTDIVSTSAVSGPTTSPNGVPLVGRVNMPYLLNNRTAFTPGGGQVYYRNAYVLRNELEVGITNGWSAGVVFNPLIQNLYQTSDYLNQAVYTNTDFGTQLYTRVGVPIGRKVRLGAVFSAQLQNPIAQFGLQTAYQGSVLATFGDERANVTLGYSFRVNSQSLYSFLNSEEAITIGTRIALSPSLTFVNDNSLKARAFYTGPFARLAAALRISRRSHAFDLGLLSSVNQTYRYLQGYGTTYGNLLLHVYPYVGYNVRLSRASPPASATPGK